MFAKKNFQTWILIGRQQASSEAEATLKTIVD